MSAYYTPPTLSQFERFFDSKDDSDSDAAIGRDITLLSSLLANVRCSPAFLGNFEQSAAVRRWAQARKKRRPDPQDAWAHLASILTTGEADPADGADPFDGCNRTRTTTRTRTVAVTGQVEGDTITAAVFTRPVSGSSSSSCASAESVPAADEQTLKLSVLDLKGDRKTGRVLLERAASTSMNEISLSDHASDVLAVLNYLFWDNKPPSGGVGVDTINFTLFISRRCCRKLRARIEQGTRLWTKHPLTLIQSWYCTSEPRDLQPKQFQISQSFGDMLARYGIHPDGDGEPSTDPKGELRSYTVSDHTATLWANMLQDTLVIMLKNYDESDSGIVEHLITPQLAKDLAEKRHAGIQNLSPLEEAILRPSNGTTEVAAADVTREENEEDEETEDIPTTNEATIKSVVHYLRTLCIAYDAARFYASYGYRMSGHGVNIHAYVLSSNPSVPTISADVVRQFGDRFLEYFSFPLTKDKISLAFKDLAEAVAETAVGASEHAEATLMALACLNQSGAVAKMDFEKLTTETVQSVFKNARVPVGVSKKCCFCCHKLATLLNEHRGLEFVLQDTHATIFPWVPPAGVPSRVLVELRTILLRVLYDTIHQATRTLRSAQTSPAGSDMDLSMDHDEDLERWATWSAQAINP